MKKAGRQERAALWDGPYEPLITNHEPLLLSQEEFHGRIISPGRLFRKCTHRH